MIDDLRENAAVTHTVRTSDAGLKALREESWDSLYLDNDLGTGQLEGWRILEIAISEGILPNIVVLVTANTSARQRMTLALTNSGFRGYHATPSVFVRRDSERML